MGRLRLALLTGLLAWTPTLVSAQSPAPSTSLRPPPDAPPVHAAAPGPYVVSVIAEPTLMTHTVYRPTDLTPFTGNERLPIIAWGNGACLSYCWSPRSGPAPYSDP